MGDKKPLNILALKTAATKTNQVMLSKLEEFQEEQIQENILPVILRLPIKRKDFG